MIPRYGYTITREGTGDLKRQVVLRQYGEWVGVFASKGEALEAIVSRTDPRDRCEVIACQAKAGHVVVTALKDPDGPTFGAEFVCGDCRASFCRRPALGVKLARVLTGASA